MSVVIIEGYVAEPEPARLACPHCPRAVVVTADDRVTERVCAGSPITGATHPPAAMTRTVSAALVRRWP